MRQALADVVLPVRKVPERAAPVLGAHEVTIRRWLIEDLDCFIGACVVFVVVQSGRHATGNHIVAAEELA